jgi:cytochrome P450
LHAAGRDTTACTLSWCIFELLRHPEVIPRIRSEAMRFVPDILSHADPSVEVDRSAYDKMGSATFMPYLHAVVEETLRLHPSVPKQVKYAVKDDVLPGLFVY